jgi:DNA-binding transcriptional LysR family regulator
MRDAVVAPRDGGARVDILRRMPRLDPVSLRLFVAVAESGTIAAAAAREHIAAAAVSRRLSEIESALGTALLVRTNRGVEPTAAGRALLGLARRALHELDQVGAQMRGFGSGLRGLVRVAASLSAITPADLESFVVAHPDVQLHLEEKISQVVTRTVAENSADIGIYTAAVTDERLQTFPYHADRLVLVVPRAHPLAARASTTLAQALCHPFVGLHTGSAIDTLLARAAAEAQRPLNLRIQVTSFDALCMMVGHGLGVGVLPEAVARRNAAVLDIAPVALEDAVAQRRFRLCVRDLDGLPAAARLLLEHLRERAAQRVG